MRAGHRARRIAVGAWTYGAVDAARRFADEGLAANANAHHDVSRAWRSAVERPDLLQACFTVHQRFARSTAKNHQMPLIVDHGLVRTGFRRHVLARDRRGLEGRTDPTEPSDARGVNVVRSTAARTVWDAWPAVHVSPSGRKARCTWWITAPTLNGALTLIPGGLRCADVPTRAVDTEVGGLPRSPHAHPSPIETAQTQPTLCQAQRSLLTSGLHAS